MIFFDDFYIITTGWLSPGSICTAMEFGVFEEPLSTVWHCCLDLQLMAGFIKVSALIDAVLLGFGKEHCTHGMTG